MSDQCPFLFASGKQCAKPLHHASAHGLALTADDELYGLESELAFANAERERLTAELRAHYAMRVKAEAERDRLTKQLLQDGPMAALARAFVDIWETLGDSIKARAARGALLDLAREQRKGG